jgi:hypothetical protein
MSEIDPKEFGQLQAEVQALRRENERLLDLLERWDIRLANIEKKLSEARGGWIVLVAIGSAMGGLIELGASYVLGRGGS